MTANRLTPDGTTSTTGSDLMDDLRAEIIALYASSTAPLSSVSGTNALTASATPPVTAYSAGLGFWFEPANTNTDAVTIDIDGVGAADLVDRDGDPLAAGDLVADRTYLIIYRGSAFRLMAGINTSAIETVLAGADIQTFDTSGTWTKPSGFPDDAVARIQVWGGGGGGGTNATSGAGGGGGRYSERWVKLSDLSATETVTVGTGGAVDTAGGNSSFGSLLTAYGGGPGGAGTGGGGGGGGSDEAGSAGQDSTDGATGGAGGAIGGGDGGYADDSGSGGDQSTDGGDASDGDGGGGGGGPSKNGGRSVRGGGGGGGGSGGTGGASIEGGDGGDAGSAGSAPGGGGGANAAGGAGRVKVTVLAAGRSAQGDQGDTGEAGGGIAIPYVFSTTTTDADPGAGKLRLNQATQNTATVIRADLLDANGADVTTLLDSLDDSTSTLKGHVRLFNKSDPSKFLLGTLSAIATPSGYRNLTIAIVGYSAASPFADADNIVMTFAPKGDKGDTGATGSAGAAGSAALQLTFDSATTDADPGDGDFRFNNATLASVTEIYVDDVEAVGGGSIAALVATWDDSTSTVKGRLRINGVDDPTVWADFLITAVTAASGYSKIAVTYVAGNGSFVNADSYAFEFADKGDKGDTGATGSAGSTGAAGSDGADGFTSGFRFAWLTDTSDSDPGSGNAKANNATFASITKLWFDNADAAAADVTTWLDGLDDSDTSNHKGYLRIEAAADPDAYMEFVVTGSVVDKTGYRELPVDPVASAGTISNTDAIVVNFSRTGDKGADGAGAVDSVNGQTGTVVLDPDDLDDTATTNKFTTAGDISKLAGIEAAADVTDAGNVGAAITGATGKTTPVDADELGLIDSAASNILKKLTWANLKATLKTYFDSLYVALTTLASTSNGEGASLVGIEDSGGLITAATVEGALAENRTAIDAIEADYLDSGDIGVSVQAYDANLTTWAGKTAPSGTPVGTTDSQTLTNKTLTDPDVTIAKAVTETPYPITDGAGFAIDPTNGAIQTITLGASRTPTAANWASGQSVTLMVDDGSAYTITWTTIGVTWKTDGGSAPTLNTSGYTTIELWKVGSTYYGARVGDA